MSLLLSAALLLSVVLFPPPPATLSFATSMLLWFGGSFSVGFAGLLLFGRYFVLFAAAVACVLFLRLFHSGSLCSVHHLRGLVSTSSTRVLPVRDVLLLSVVAVLAEAHSLLLFATTTVSTVTFVPRLGPSVMSSLPQRPPWVRLPLSPRCSIWYPSHVGPHHVRLRPPPMLFRGPRYNFISAIKYGVRKYLLTSLLFKRGFQRFKNSLFFRWDSKVVIFLKNRVERCSSHLWLSFPTIILVIVRRLFKFFAISRS
jgi:hypothetical protein